MMRRLFGTSGVRGIFGEDLSPQKILEIGLAIGSYYGEGAKA
jgi:phosphomannomutase/phosphoglucomutase